MYGTVHTNTQHAGARPQRFFALAASVVCGERTTRRGLVRRITICFNPAQHGHEPVWPSVRSWCSEWCSLQRRARAPVRDTHASTHRTRVKVITYAARSSSGIRDKLSLHATRSLSHNARPSRIAGALHDASLSLNVCHGLGDVEELRERRSASARVVNQRRRGL